jgi:hypothetical protein
VESVETVERRGTVTATRTVIRPPTQRGVFVDLGQYDGSVDLLGVRWNGSSFGSEVIGQMQYLGGLGCNVLSYLEITASLFDNAGTLAENALTNETDVVECSRFPFSIHFDAEISRGHVDLLVTKANC